MSGPTRDPVGLLDFWVPRAAFTCTSYTLERTERGRTRAPFTLRVGGLPGSRPKAHSGTADALRALHARPAYGQQRRHVLRTLLLAADG